MSSSSSSLGSSTDEYSSHAREFRHFLLSKQESGNTHAGAKQYLKKVFKLIDENSDGTITDMELYDFMMSIDIPQQVAEILIQQIDLNHDKKVSYSELAEFLWPRVESQREIGIVIELVRDALISCIGRSVINKALKHSTEANDAKLLSAFAEKTNAVLIRGNLIDVRQLKKALHNLMPPELGALSGYEIDMLVHSMDANGDSVVTAREFKSWLFLQKGYFRLESGVNTAGSNSFALESESFEDLAPQEDERGADEQLDREPRAGTVLADHATAVETLSTAIPTVNSRTASPQSNCDAIDDCNTDRVFPPVSKCEETSPLLSSASGEGGRAESATGSCGPCAAVAGVLLFSVFVYSVAHALYREFK